MLSSQSVSLVEVDSARPISWTSIAAIRSLYDENVLSCSSPTESVCSWVQGSKSKSSTAARSDVDSFGRLEIDGKLLARCSLVMVPDPWPRKVSKVERREGADLKMHLEFCGDGVRT